MLPTEGKKFRNVIVGMGRMFGQELDQLVLDAYWLALSDWEFEDFEAAAAHLLKTAEFMPRPNAFNGLRKAGRWTGGEAWTWVLSRYPAHRCECNEPSEQDRDLAERCVSAIGGWHAIDMCDVDKIGFLERRFLEHYETMSDRDEVREAVPRLTGYAQSARISGPQPINSVLARLTRDRLDEAEPKGTA